MRLLLLSVLMVAGFVLSGCVAKSADTSETQTNLPISEPEEIVVTDTTGGIRGVVVDPAIRPIKGVLVAITGNGVAKNLTTGEGGTFTVSGLPEGSYLISASHPLFVSVQQSVDVEAGVKTPDIVKLVMEGKVRERPYMTTTLFKGFIVCSVGGSYVASEECGEGVGVPCVQDPAPCGRTGGQDENNVQYDFRVDGSYVRSIIIEQAWTPASEATGNLYTVAPATNWTCNPICGGNQIADMAGASPLLSRVEVIEGLAIAHPPVIAGSGSTFSNQTITADTLFSTFTWPEWGSCPPGITNAIQGDPTCLAQANVATNQEFKLFVSNFYFAPAPEGWSLAKGDTNPFV